MCTMNLTPGNKIKIYFPFHGILREAADRLGLTKLSKDERYAWLGWAPLVMNLQSIERWSSQNRPKPVNIIKAKSGHRESDYVKALADHRPLQRTIIKYAKQIDV